MLVWHGGQSGTIGGGALELEAAEMALRGASVRRVPLGPSLGQCCGGAVTLVTEVFEAAPKVGNCCSTKAGWQSRCSLLARRFGSGGLGMWGVPLCT